MKLMIVRIICIVSFLLCFLWKDVCGDYIITTIAGTGSDGYSGDGGAATSAQLNNPAGVALDSSGNVYIADYSNNRIRKLTPTCAAGQYWRGFPPCLPCPGGKFSSSIGRYLTFIVVSVYICLYDIYKCIHPS